MTQAGPGRVRDALRRARDLLTEHSTTPALDAGVLLQHATGWSAARLVMADAEPLDARSLEKFLALVERRAGGEPVAYICGHREFWSLDLEVTPGVLVPRPDTETLVEAILARGPRDSPLRMLDLGTGSGNVALAVASERPGWHVTATDIEATAIEVTRRNSARLGLQLEILCGSWFDTLAGRRFDIIASNPPYIPAGDPHLDDLRFEPRVALVSADAGLRDLREICSRAPQFLSSQGWLILEHGSEQAGMVDGFLQAAGFGMRFLERDLGGNGRVSGGRLD